jgi:hypothetical protein
MRPLALILMAVLALALLDLVAEVALTPGMEILPFLHRVGQCLLALGGGGLALGWLKSRCDLGCSALLGRASLFLILAGPLVFCACWSLSLERPDCLKFAGTALVLCATGCLFYRVSLADPDRLARLH